MAARCPDGGRKVVVMLPPTAALRPFDGADHLPRRIDVISEQSGRSVGKIGGGEMGRTVGAGRSVQCVLFVGRG